MVSIPLRTIPLTCVEDGHSHQVTDEMAAGMHAGIGRYRTLCGRTVTTTFMIEPEGLLVRGARCRPHRRVAGSVRARRVATARSGFSDGCSHGA